MNIKIPKKYEHLDIHSKLKATLTAIYGNKDNVIIIGSAGVGKSVVINMMSDIDFDEGIKSALIAPTGIAAVNIKGSTIHRLFGMGIL